MRVTDKRFSKKFCSLPAFRLAARSAAVVFALSACAVANAGAPAGTDEVQEDWVLVIQAVSPDESAPQIANIISPIETIDSEYGVLELNHTTQPDYVDGGIQLQRWNGDYLCDFNTPPSNDRLVIADETITYTMTMKILPNGKLEFGVVNGQSETWGDFGGTTGNWRTQVDAPYTDLTRYDRAVSTEHTRICFASNLVASFVQKEVRYYKNGQLLQTDTADVAVYQAAAAE